MLDIENMDEDDEEIDEVKMDLTNFDPFSQPIAVAEARNSQTDVLEQIGEIRLNSHNSISAQFDLPRVTEEDEKEDEEEEKKEEDRLVVKEESGVKRLTFRDANSVKVLDFHYFRGIHQVDRIQDFY